MKSTIRLPSAVFAFSLLFAPAAAQENDEGWKDTAEFSFVLTDGNSESQSLGFKNKLWRAWDRSSFELKAGGIRVETTSVTDLFAIGTQNDFRITRITESDLTAENYYLNGKYSREISKRFFWNAGAGWDRNEFAGIADRYTAYGGVGHVWVARKKVKWRTDYSLSYTKQDDVVEDPARDDTFAGLRASSTLLLKFGANSSYGNDTTIDENLDETEDLRVDMTNWVAVSMTDHLALKLSLQWLYDNLPALEEVELFDKDPRDPTPPAAMSLGFVTRELDDLDTIFTASLVLNF